MISIESPQSELSPAGLSRFLNRASRAIGVSGEIDVLLADDSTLRRLNKTFRGKNKPTDVLSFPSPPEIAAAHAGDLAISLETAARQAEACGHSLRDEVRVLLLHGLLHLSGLDHETDNGEMAARESTLRRELRLPNTLIERVNKPAQRPNTPPQRTGKPAPRTGSRKTGALPRAVSPKIASRKTGRKI